MGGGKHFGLFHTQCSQFVDIEETPVVDLLRGYTPVTETIDLALQQSVEQIEALWLTRRAIEKGYCVLKKGPHRRIRLGQCCQAPLDDFLFALALGYPGWIRFAT